MSIRAAAYVRRFADEQADGVPDVEQQRRRLESYIDEQGWELGGVYEEVGTTDFGAWPALRALLANLDRLDKVVVLRFDRLPHSARRMASIIRRLDRADVDLVTLREQFDTNAGRGDAVRKVLELVSRWSPTDQQPGNGWKPDNLRRPGLAPATVIDVGVAHGTPSLYEAFPDAHLVLIEPLQEFREELSSLASRLGGEYLMTAVGAATETSTIHIHRSAPQSSLMTRIQGEEDAARREIPVTTLDKLAAERGWQAPFGLKLDVEGYEPFVIQGATKMLEETQFVIAELAISPRFEGDWTSGQFIELMRSRGFEVVDVLDATRAYADLRFGRVP